MTDNSKTFDLLIRNGKIATESGFQKLDIGILAGKIFSIRPKLNQPADRIIDAFNRLIFPGFIDSHTHMGIPIKDTMSADDFDSGSIAAAFGGVTTILDFTVQQKGQSLKDALRDRMNLAKGKSCIDFGMHINVTDQPEKWLYQIPELIEDGFTSFKVFSTYREAGMMIDWEQFRRILKIVNDNGGLLMLHAEDNDTIEVQTRNNIRAGNSSAIYHARSRPADAEAKAINTAAKIAGELDARLYIVHVSSRIGLETALKAREQGVKLYLETCPQYLLLDESRYCEDNGYLYIATPPLRTKEDNNFLWEAIRDGIIDTVGTDHCPFTIAQKNLGGGSFQNIPNGLPGVETLFPLLYTYGVCEGRISFKRLIDVLVTNPAAIFGLSQKKGAIQIDHDADLVIWNPPEEKTISNNNLHGRADWSPYVGMEIKGELEFTILRGNILVEKGELTELRNRGKLLRSDETT